MTVFLKPSEIGVAGAKTLPREFFTSPVIFAEEMTKIFSRRWLCVGREDRLVTQGQYFLQPVGRDSIIVLRDRAGVVRAFHNVCRHRGTLLCEEDRGQFRETIQCPYHAWTYSLDGKLVGAPSSEGIEDFHKADYPLHQVAVALWEGFLFINLSPNPEPFEKTYAPMIERVKRYNVSQLKVARQIVYDVKSNWKLLVQNYSECYHCGPVHPALAKLSPPTSGENDLIEGPFLGGFMTLNKGHGSMTMSGGACGVPVSDLPEEDHSRVYYYSLFPNMLLSLHPDYVMAHQLWPQGTDRTAIICEWLFHPDSLSDPKFNPDDGVTFWDMTNRQDWHICEVSQAGVQSSAYTPGPYSNRECISAAFDREVLKALGR